MVNSYIALDLETTGLNPKRERIIEIGALRVEDGQIRETFHTLVNPHRPLSPEIRELTGIRDEMLASCQDMAQVLPGLLAFCQELPLLGHKVLFDYSFIKRAAVNAGCEWEREGVDTLVLCRRFMPPEEKKSLAAACAYYGVGGEGWHRALSDACRAHRLYQKLKEQFGNAEPDAFLAKKLLYKVKREQPASKRQKERLQELLKYHRIEAPVQMDDLTRNEASRFTDQILSMYGRLGTGVNRKANQSAKTKKEVKVNDESAR